MNVESTTNIVAVGMIAIMLIGMTAVIQHRVKTKMGFGYRFIQVLAIVEVVPSVVLLAVIGILKGEAAAALIGTVAGYAFGLKSKEE